MSRRRDRRHFGPAFTLSAAMRRQRREYRSSCWAAILLAIFAAWVLS